MFDLHIDDGGRVFNLDLGEHVSRRVECAKWFVAQTYFLRRDPVQSGELTLLNLNVQMSHFRCTCNKALHQI